MAMKVKMDGSGRLVLPKPVRDRLGLAAGDALELESSGDQLTLRPVRERGSVQKEHGIWIFRGGRSLSAELVRETLERTRDERASSVVGHRKK